MSGIHSSRHLNLNIRDLGVSATLWINERSKQLEADGQTVYKLGLGQSPFPVPETVVRALQENAYQKDYLPVKGLPELRAAVAGFHRDHHQVEGNAEDVLIGPGSKELMFLLQLVYYGDLLIPNPSWVSYAPQARIIGRNVRWLDTHSSDDWRLTPEALDAYCSADPDCPRIIILNYPANPSGTTYGADELQGLAAVARKHSLIVLADEIYAELHHRGEHISLARYYPEGTIISSGLSKWCGAGGWRLGTFLFPPALSWLRDAMAAVASETYTTTSAPIQFAAIQAFSGAADIGSYLHASRRILGGLGMALANRFRAKGLSLPEPSGGFYLFLDFSEFKQSLQQRGILDNTELCRRLLDETGVAILPGSAFGRPAQELTARLAYVDFDGAGALAAMSAAEPHTPSADSLLERCCPRPLKAAELICDWL